MAEWIWIHLLQRKQGLWYELPCGLHAEVDVLRGAAIELITSEQQRRARSDRTDSLTDQY